MSETPSAPLLQASGLRKSFGATHAVVNASLVLNRGEIHALLGANGAGKSTCSKIISGHVRHDAGTLLWRGQPVAFRSTREALSAGIAIVLQETSLAPDLSVLENIFLPTLATPGRLSFSALRRRADEVLHELGPGAALPLDARVAQLSAAQRQLVEIAKALASDAELILFDEPTASLSPGEVEHLFDVMDRLRRKGRALVFVSHRLEEVFAITDRVTVMREGATVAASVPTAELTQADIIRLMVGRDLGEIFAAPDAQASHADEPVVLEVKGLRSLPAVRDVSFAVRRGEILGLGGLVGAGRSETAEAIFGLRPHSAGELRLHGKPLHLRTPAAAVRAGLGFVPEDRRVQNIVPDFSVRENLLLAHLGAHRGFGLGYGKRNAKVDELLARLDLPADRLLDANMLNFSGGMQQKIIIARWLLLEPAVLILDEPTKGVDIGTRQAIYALLREVAAQGVAVVVISSDFEELLGLCSRVVVISDGHSIADLPTRSLSPEKLTLLAAPRTSMQGNTALLQALASEHNGAGFWSLIEDDQLICLNTVVINPRLQPGFKAGEAIALADTAIPEGLRQRGQESFVRESGCAHSSLVLPLRNRRGHDMGWIGLTLEGPHDAATVANIRARIEAIHD